MSGWQKMVFLDVPFKINSVITVSCDPFNGHYDCPIPSKILAFVLVTIWMALLLVVPNGPAVNVCRWYMDCTSHGRVWTCIFRCSYKFGFLSQCFFVFTCYLIYAGFQPCPWHAEISLHAIYLLMTLLAVDGDIPKVAIVTWETLFLNCMKRFIRWGILFHPERRSENFEDVPLVMILSPLINQPVYLWNVLVRRFCAFHNFPSPLLLSQL